jgi:LuxR family maltose regulon positive regulatory protein
MNGDDAGVAVPLLRTKLHAPARRQGVVERPRLTERAIGRELPALTLVSAPAGFGKTTLLVEWFADPRDANRRTAWLALDARDDDAVVFWSYVVAAVQTVAPDAGADALALLQAAQPLEAVVSSLLNDLAAVAGEVVVVLDDYHVVASAEIHEAMAFLLDHLPASVHVVLAGRADPPLPLARWRARGQLLEIRAADLRFTADEAVSYCNDSMGLRLTADDVAALDARTEGWIAALQLAALSMQGRDDASGFIASFAGDDRFVLDYLAEEVLDRQPDEVRSFLLDTAILDRFTGALCDAVTGSEGGRAMLERLDRANLFLVPLDDRRQWYRYHHLFADVLRARLLDEQPARLDRLHRRASAWYEAAGEAPEAIDHALAGHDVEQAARLIELAAPAMFQTRQEATARRWLTALPDDLFPDRPVLSMERVGARMVSGETTDVERLLGYIEPWLDPAVDQSTAIVYDHAELARLPAQVAVYRAALALIAGDIPATIEHAGRALALAGPTDHLRQGSAGALMGLALWTIGDLDAARERYLRAVASLADAGHLSDALGCSIALADIQLAQGRLGDAIGTYEAGLVLAATHGVVRGTGDMHVGLAEAWLERDDLAGAVRHLDASAAVGDPGGLPQHPYRWRVALARVRRREGDRAAALELLTAAERVENTDLSPSVRPVAAMKARAELANGDVAAARRWVASRRLAADDELSYVHEFEHLTLARVLLAGRDGSNDDAVALLERLLDAAERGGRAATTIEVRVLLAIALDARGRRDDAVEVIEAALATAEPEGYRRMFVDELPGLEPVLRAVTDPGPAADVARDVLASARGAEVASSPQGLVDQLTSRELEVLRLLRGDLSGPEIARELLVSLNTLRTHTRNIYTKLGVTNRREAVRRAAELGL